MASIKEKIEAALFSNATLSIAWGLALFANTALVAMGLVNKDVPGAVAAMLGAIAAALMIFSIFLKEKADAEDEAETAAQASSATADGGEEDGDTIVEELLAEIEAETAAQASREAAAAVGSAKSGEAGAGEE